MLSPESMKLMKKTIVCVRSVDDSIKMIMKLFGSLGWEVKLARDGFTALPWVYKYPSFWSCKYCFGLFEATLKLVSRARPSFSLHALRKKV